MESFQQINNHILLHKENKKNKIQVEVQLLKFFFGLHVQVEVDIKD
jgi:hypothetical protein